jgi:hypothetical protein
MAVSGSLGPSVEELISTNTVNTGSLQLVGSITASAFSGSAVGLTNVPFRISGSDVEGNQSDKTFTKLHFDSDTGLNVSESAPGTAFISIGSHFKDIFVSGSPILSATGSDAFEIIPTGGVEITTSITDTNGNGYVKELNISTTTLSSSLNNRMDTITGSITTLSSSVNSLNTFTSSVVLTSQTSSMNVLSASYALTAAFALNAGAGGGNSSLSDGAYAVLNQTTPATTWTFKHNLGQRYPIFQVFDSNGSVILPSQITTIDINNATITFPSNQTGKVIASLGTGPGGLSQYFSSNDTWSLAHNLSSDYPIVTIWDTNRNIIFPQRIESIDNNNIKIYFSTPVAGYVNVAKGGHIISGSVSAGSIDYIGSNLVSGSGQILITGTTGYSTFSGSISSSIGSLSSSVATTTLGLSSSILSLSSSVALTTSGLTSTITTLSSSLSSSIDSLSSSVASINNTQNGRLDSLETASGSIRSNFNTFTSSYNTGSFTGSFKGDGTNLYNIPASGVTGLELYKIVSGSVSASISPNNGFRVNTDVYIDGSLTAKELFINYISSSVLYQSGSTKFGDTLDDTHEFTGSVNITGSISLNGQPIGTGKLDEVTFNLFTSSYTTGSFTGSFIGDGSQLTNIPASGVTGLNLNKIVSGSVSASISPNRGLEINTDTTISGSLQISGSGFLNSHRILTDLDTGSMGLINSIQFNTSSNISVKPGELAWNNTDGTLDLGMKGGNVVQQIGQEIFYEVRNETGIQIPNGTAVYANGVTAGGGRITIAPYTADGSIRENRFLGIATENITSGINGFVTHFGYVRGLDTRGTTVSSIAVGDETWAVGDILYVHPTVAGKLTNVKPQHEVTVAIVINRHQSAGILFVRPSSGGHLEDVHDILINTGSLTNGQVLAYNSTNGLWENTNTISGSLNVTGGLTGSIDYSNLTNKPTLVSGSSQISYSGLTGIPSGIVSSSTQLNTLGYATTGSNLFKGNQTISGSIIPAVDNTYDLGSLTNQFRDLYLSSASLYIDGTKVLGSTAQELQITTDTGQSFKILEASSDTITLQSADGNITLATSGGGDVIMDPTTGVIALKGTTTIYAGNKIVSSDGNSIQFGNGIAITGSIISTVTSLVSGSSQITYSGLTGIPSGIASGSSQIDITGTTGYSTFSSSISTSIGSLSSSVATTTSGLSSSVGSLSSSFATTTIGLKNRIDSIETTTGSLNTFTSSASGRLTSLETASGSIRTDFNTYTGSNDSTNTTQNSRLTSIEGITGSISSLNTYTGSNNTIIGTLQTATSSLNSYTSSNTTNINAIHTSTGSFKSFTSSFDTAFGMSGADVTVKGNLTVSGTQTIVNSTTVAIGDNIIQLNGTGATNAGLVVRDATAPNTVSGSFLWDSTNDKWIAGSLGSEDDIVLRTATQTLTNKTINASQLVDASVTNTKLANSSITIAGTSTSLGGTISAATILSGTGTVSGSAQIDLTATTNYASGILTRLNAVGVFSGSAQVTGIGNAQLTNSSFHVGTTSISLGRASASQTLTGVSIDGNSATSTNISNSGTVTLASATESNAITITQPSYTTNTPVKLLNFDWYGNTWSLGNIRSGDTGSNGFGVFLSSVEKFRFTATSFLINGYTTLHSNNYSTYASPLAGSSSITTLGTITSGTWNGTSIAIANGGTGGTTAATARTNLGLAIGTDVLAYRTFGTAANSATGDFATYNATTYVGTTAIALNRASASQTLTGVSIDGNAATVTNGVYTTGDQSISGTKTFAVIKGDSGADYPHSFTNTDAGNTHWTNRNGRMLTSNGTNWAADGKDPIMAIVGSTADTTRGRMIGITFHNDNNTVNAFSPTISFSAKSNSSSYNSEYASIYGRNSGAASGLDTNWNKGELHFTVHGDAAVSDTPTLRMTQTSSTFGTTITANSYTTNSGQTGTMSGNAYPSSPNSYFGLRHGSMGASSSEYMIISANADTYISCATGSSVYLRPSGNSEANGVVSTTGAFRPETNNSINLGTASYRWQTVYMMDLSLSNGIGDYTIVEGEEKLYLYNNKNNKVYSFVLQEEDPTTATPKMS